MNIVTTPADRGAAMPLVRSGVCQLSCGPVWLAGYDRTLIWLGFTSTPSPLRFWPDITPIEDRPWAESMAPVIDAVWRGQGGDLAITLRGTAFQRAVWQALLAIPFGETRSYGDIAASVGRPKAVRAVGSAVGANPVALLIPCHRVLPTDGSLGNYGFGPEIKRALLAEEGVAL